jgi:hypothetical protein
MYASALAACLDDVLFACKVLIHVRVFPIPNPVFFCFFFFLRKVIDLIRPRRSAHHPQRKATHEPLR